MRSEDYLTLPDVVENDISVELPEEARAHYKAMEDEFFMELAALDATGEAQHIEAVSAGAKAMKLRQLASGFVFDEMGEWHEVHRAKLDALSEIVESLRGQPALIAYYFKPDLERIGKAFPQANRLSTAEDITKWNRGEIPLALVNAASHGHGLNLQDGGHHIVFYSLDWNLDNHLQLRKRLHRSGQKNTVIEHYIEAKNTVDGLIRKRLATKRTVQDLLYEALKQRT
jgi:SNF2 family DNA or RNA helicase